ncbi:MAG: DUF4194 domain-containing protein [Eubacterium aggregans]|uniref:DUF4194 domain-containing protein n=1 Tax=Eubacterium aggregans TaxID=81409 RepID=UPI002B20DF43|nr:DUF4194 domain-containing protein [Eubacterium aggregans]MEA5074225.1 DUF4194 domain-containing protein [Eubacterium aggregans]
MWSEDFEKLSSYEKGEFRRLSNYLLSHTYLVRYEYQSSQKMTMPSSDYTMVSRLFSVMQEYFSVSGWKLEKDDNYGVISLINIYDHNRLRVDRFTTLFLYTCRLIYEEHREESGQFHTVRTDTQTIVEKMRMLGLLEKGKTSQKERLDAQRTLSHYNVLQKMDSTWSNEGNQLLILPSILSMVSNQGINDMMIELEEMKNNEIQDHDEGEESV